MFIVDENPDTRRPLFRIRWGPAVDREETDSARAYVGRILDAHPEPKPELVQYRLQAPSPTDDELDEQPTEPVLGNRVRVRFYDDTWLYATVTGVDAPIKSHATSTGVDGERKYKLSYSTQLTYDDGALGSFVVPDDDVCLTKAGASAGPPKADEVKEKKEEEEEEEDMDDSMDIDLDDTDGIKKTRGNPTGAKPRGYSLSNKRKSRLGTIRNKAKALRAENLETYEVTGPTPLQVRAREGGRAKRAQKSASGSGGRTKLGAAQRERSERADKEPLLPLLFFGRSGQARGLEGRRAKRARR
jgi:hypothetical protein